MDARILFGDVPTYLIGLDGRRYGIFELEVHGFQGRLKIEDFGRKVKWYPRESSSGWDAIGELSPRPAFQRKGSAAAMALALGEVIRAILAKARVRSDGESALATLRVCHRLAAQASRRLVGRGWRRLSQ